jgi:hypothetical protein
MIILDLAYIFTNFLLDFPCCVQLEILYIGCYFG